MSMLDEHFVRLMRNWALATAGRSQCSASAAYTGMMGRGAYDSGMPVLRGEVADVDIAFPALDSKDRSAVQLYWLYEGRSFVWLGERLGCSDKTVVSRCIDGHGMLRAELARRRKMAGQLIKYMNAC